jgi:hypothetical protein
VCPHTAICVSSYYCIFVLILLYMCPHTTFYVSSYYYIFCPHTTVCVSSYYYIFCPHTTVCVLILLYILSSYYCICVLTLLYMCPHTIIYETRISQPEVAEVKILFRASLFFFFGNRSRSAPSPNAKPKPLTLNPKRHDLAVARDNPDALSRALSPSSSILKALLLRLSGST